MYIVFNKQSNQYAICNSKSSIARFLEISYNGIDKVFKENRLDNKRFSIITPAFIQLKALKRGKITQKFKEVGIQHRIIHHK